jgi:hypothetical protein
VVLRNFLEIIKTFQIYRKFSQIHINISIVAKISYKSPNSFCFALSLHVWTIRKNFRHFRKQFSRTTKTNTFFEKKFVTFASDFREMRKRTSFPTLILIAQIFIKSTALLIKTKKKVRGEIKNEQYCLNIWRQNHLQGCVTKYKILPTMLMLVSSFLYWIIGFAGIFPQKTDPPEALPDFFYFHRPTLAFSLSPSLLKLLAENLF